MAADVAQTDAAAVPPPAKVSFTVSLAASHWVGQTFGTPLGISTPAINVGVHPGL